jgi:type VI secretion system protein ImpG
MTNNESLIRLYQDEFQALREFLATYSLEHRSSGLQSTDANEDPDVARLLQSIAFFAARTHENALRHVDEYRLRLYGQLFSYLLTSLPAVGILKAHHSGSLNEPVFVDRGTNILLKTDAGQNYFFTTRAPLHVYPISIENLTTVPVEPFGFKLSLHFSSRYTLTALPERLTFYLDYINDVSASFQVLGFFKKNLVNIQMKLSRGGIEQAEDDWYSLPLPTFGPIPLEVEDTEFLHPMEDERLFFRDPRSELFMHLAPPILGESFKNFVIEFEFSERWPRGFIPNVDLFNLHCVPVINLQRAVASPINADGTLSRFPILHSDPEGQFELFKPIGVYKAEEEGMSPLTPAILADEDGSYELSVDYNSQLQRRVSHLHLHLPSAFIQPVPVFVDALWQQPSYIRNRERPGEFTTYQRIYHGVSWGWQAIPAEHYRNPSAGMATDEILQILAMSHKRFYSYEDLRALLEVFGPLQHGIFRQILEAFKGSRYELRLVEGDRLTAGYVIYFLDFDFERLDHQNYLFDVFLGHLERVLNHWSAEREVRLTVDTQLDHDV